MRTYFDEMREAETEQEYLYWCGEAAREMQEQEYAKMDDIDFLLDLAATARDLAPITYSSIMVTVEFLQQHPDYRIQDVREDLVSRFNLETANF